MIGRGQVIAQGNGSIVGGTKFADFFIETSEFIKVSRMSGGIEQRLMRMLAEDIAEIFREVF